MSKADNLKNYLPKYYSDSLIVSEMMDAEGIEFDKLNADIYEVLDQFYIDTATWGLSLWEREFDIKSNKNETFEMRRARLKSKITGTGTFTPADAVALANQFSEPKTAEFVHIPSRYAFGTKHNVDHLIDFNRMIEAFEEMKPAHLRHIKGLIITTDMYEVKEYMRLRGWTVVKIDLKHISHKMLTVRAGFAGTSFYIDSTWSPYLFLNGAWKLDGTFKLNGKNPHGADWYSNKSDKLTIRQGSTIIEVV